MTDATKNVWPLKLRIRDTQLHDDLGGAGMRIYTTAGQGYEKREYVRADEIERLTERGDIGWAKAKDLDARIERLEAEIEAYQQHEDEIIVALGSKGILPSEIVAEIERLEGALKPFADAHYALYESEDFNPYKYITMHHLRMAAEALDSKEQT